MEVTDGFEIPEPDFESYADCSIPVLEAEIQVLANGHLKDLGEIGPRVFWLNQKYKAKKKVKGTGVKAFCAMIGFDLHHWNYLVRVFTPEDIKKERLAAKEARRLKKLEMRAAEPVAEHQNTELERLQDEPAPKLEMSINGFEGVRALVKERLASLSPSKQKKELADLKEWIIGQLLDLEDEIKSQQAA